MYSACYFFCWLGGAIILNLEFTCSAHHCCSDAGCRVCNWKLLLRIFVRIEAENDNNMYLANRRKIYDLAPLCKCTLPETGFPYPRDIREISYTSVPSTQLPNSVHSQSSQKAKSPLLRPPHALHPTILLNRSIHLFPAVQPLIQPPQQPPQERRPHHSHKGRHAVHAHSRYIPRRKVLRIHITRIDAR